MTRPATNSTRRKGTVRCAIYTRKSSEEGLEQAFNSLQAQREACEAFITSQRHEGWACLPKAYDDGGFSGARMDRPALQRLLADIAAGRVDSYAGTETISADCHRSAPERQVNFTTFFYINSPYKLMIIHV
jgi:hypothetical protein